MPDRPVEVQDEKGPLPHYFDSDFLHWLSQIIPAVCRDLLVYQTMKISTLLAHTAPLFAALAAALPAGESALEERQSASSWFLPNLDHTSGPVRGYVPNLPTYDYPVYKSVKSGDSQGLINAITSDGPSGARNNCWLAGQPRVIYLAPGEQLSFSTGTFQFY